MSPAVEGVAAGVVGAVALAGVDRAERAILGREPVYAPVRIARRLIRGTRRSPRVLSSAMGVTLRVAYSSAIGATYGAVDPARTRGPVAGGLALAGAILAFEVGALPTIGATPRLRDWTWSERLLLAGHTAVFGMTVAAVFRVLRSSAARRVASMP